MTDLTKERERPFKFDERAHLWQQVLYTAGVKTRGKGLKWSASRKQLEETF